MSVPLWAWIVIGLAVVCVIMFIIRFTTKKVEVEVLSYQYIDLYIHPSSAPNPEEVVLHRGMIQFLPPAPPQDVNYRIKHHSQAHSPGTEHVAYNTLDTTLTVIGITLQKDVPDPNARFPPMHNHPWYATYMDRYTAEMKRLVIKESTQGPLNQRKRTRIVYGEEREANQYYAYKPSHAPHDLVPIQVGDDTDNGYSVESIGVGDWVPWDPTGGTDEIENMMVWLLTSTERVKLTALLRGELIINGKEVTKGFNKVYRVSYSGIDDKPKYIYTVFPFLIEIVDDVDRLAPGGRPPQA
jgi:hypothetical protein